MTMYKYTALHLRIVLATEYSEKKFSKQLPLNKCIA